MAFLTPDKTRNEYGLEIKEKIIPDGNKLKPNRKLSNGTGKVEYITVHNTNDIKEAEGTNDAEQYTRATYNGNMNGVTVHYYIDETDCWQLLNEDEVGYHAADGRDGPGNTTSLAIEIIMDGSGFKADVEAERRGALLAAILLYRHGLGVDRLTTHNRWYSKKYCPVYILPHWDSFKSQVEMYLREIQAESDVEKVTPSGMTYIVQAGAFLSEENAEAFKNDIIKKGFDAIIAYSEPYYLVRVGTFSVKENAYTYKETLGASGIDCIVIEIENQVIDEVKHVVEEVKQIVEDIKNFGKKETFTAADAREALRISVGLEEISEDAMDKYDMDGDGKITAADAREILRKSVGLE